MSTMNVNEGDLVVWVDIETTGLVVKDGLPLELGILITDLDLKPIAGYSRLIQWGKLDWWTDDEEMHYVSEYVTKMHEASGLRQEYDAGVGQPAGLVERQAITFLESHHAIRYPMAGSNVANFDRLWIAEYFPGLNDAFHYRNQDISSAKEMCRRWNPEVYAKLPDKVEKHRVIPDCLDTVEEFRFYRDSFLFTTR